MLPIQQVIKNIGNRLGDLHLGKPSFADSRYYSHDFNVNNFHPIFEKEGKSLLGFIDGGNMPILDAHNFSVHLVRVYFNLFRGKKRIINWAT